MILRVKRATPLLFAAQVLQRQPNTMPQTRTTGEFNLHALILEVLSFLPYVLSTLHQCTLDPIL